MNIDSNTKALLFEACKRYKVKELYAFGSVVNGDFNEDSDIDLVVEFIRDGFTGSFDQYMDFKESVKNIFKRDVDLISIKAVRNPIFREEIEKTKEFLYAA